MEEWGNVLSLSSFLFDFGLQGDHGGGVFFALTHLRRQIGYQAASRPPAI